MPSAGQASIEVPLGLRPYSIPCAIVLRHPRESPAIHPGLRCAVSVSADQPPDEPLAALPGSGKTWRRRERRDRVRERCGSLPLFDGWLEMGPTYIPGAVPWPSRMCLMLLMPNSRSLISRRVKIGCMSRHMPLSLISRSLVNLVLSSRGSTE